MPIGLGPHADSHQESGKQDSKLSMLRAYANAAGVDLVIAFRPKQDNPDAQPGA